MLSLLLSEVIVEHSVALFVEPRGLERLRLLHWWTLARVGRPRGHYLVDDSSNRDALVLGQRV